MAPKSLLCRFKAVAEMHQTASPEDLQAYNQASQLENETIEFGKTYKGETFSQVYDNHKTYVKWFLERVTANPNPEQARFLRYIELKVMEEEAAQTPANEKTVEGETKDFEDFEDEWLTPDVPAGSGSSSSQMESPVPAAVEETVPLSLENRLDNFEHLLGQVIDNLQNLQTQPPP